MRVALLDDNPDDRLLLKNYIQQYQQENSIQFSVFEFQSGLDLLEEYKDGFEVLFLDVEMPGMNGMEVAREIRKIDEAVGIIFVTNMAQYAINGYEVNAIDFMLKPIGYYNFVEKLKKAYQYSEKRIEKELLLTGEDGMIRLKLSEIHYIEKDKNYLIYHTTKGEFAERGTMQMIRQKFEPLSFAECMTGCMVNLRHVQKVGRDTVFLETIELPMSRRMKKEFIQNFAAYIGGMT